ncbi:MAG: HD-GYP domain-containing protein [Acidimicrobiales bacterium]
MPPAPSGPMTSGESDRRWARIGLKIIAFVVPSLAGFIVAFVLLRVVRPFDTGTIRTSWIVLAVLAAVGSSLLVSRELNRTLPRTRLYRMANDFGSAVDDRYRAVLLAGGSRKVLREQRRHPATRRRSEVIGEILDQLDRTPEVGRGHSDRVRGYSMMIGFELGLDLLDIDELGWAAMLHDLGRLRVSARSLVDPAAATMGFWAPPVDPIERVDEFFRPISPWLPSSAIDAARHHADRWDGIGNGSQLVGEDIPLFARIAAVANRYDILTNGLDGETELTAGQARFEIEVESGSALDPVVVAAFLAIGDEELKSISTLSATAAGIGVIGTNAAAIATQIVVVAASITTAVIAAEPVVDDVPAELGFTENTSTTTSTSAPTTTTRVPATTAAVPTSSVDSASSTSVAAPRTVDLTYTIGTGLVDGIVTRVDAARLDVFVDDELDQTIDITDETTLVVTIDATDLEPGVHAVRFELFDTDGDLVSTEVAPIVG